MKDLVADYRVTFRLMMKEAKHKYGNDIGMILNPCHATCHLAMHGPAS